MDRRTAAAIRIQAQIRCVQALARSKEVMDRRTAAAIRIQAQLRCVQAKAAKDEDSTFVLPTRLIQIIGVFIVLFLNGTDLTSSWSHDTNRAISSKNSSTEGSSFFQQQALLPRR